MLHEVAGGLSISATTAGLLVGAAQIGYLCGLTLLVPLGDFLERRHMVPILLAASVVSLAVSAAASNLVMLLLGTFATGLAASAAQIVVPWASATAAPERRSETVATVMSGLLLGILLSRLISGAVAQFGGWRTVLIVAAGIQAIASTTVYLVAPEAERTVTTERYVDILASIVSLIRSHSVLRQRMVLGFLIMASFSGVWTAITFLLAGLHSSPYHYSPFSIGLFALAGVAGVAGAPFAGRLADRGRLRAITTLSWLILLASWLLLLWGGYNEVVLVIALLVFDLGIQSAQSTNQSAIYALDPAARSRITSAYMIAYFLGGVAGSTIAGFAYQSGGWLTVCEIGFIAAIFGSTLWTAFARRSAAAARGNNAPSAVHPMPVDSLNANILRPSHRRRFHSNGFYRR